MKFLLIGFAMMAVLAYVASAAPAEEKKSDPKLDLKEVERILAQIEAEEQKIKQKPAEDANVSESLSKLFASFRQVTSAYINVLNSVNKSLGLPKYPTLPGLQAREPSETLEARDQPTPIKQIQENLNQLQESASQVGNLVRRVVTNMSEDGRRTVLDQFRRFTDLWSNQLTEISNILSNAINSRQQDDNIFNRLNRYLEQVSRDVRQYADSLLNQIRNRINPPAQP